MAARPPAQLAEPTEGTSGSGSPAGSMMTNGIARARSFFLQGVRERGEDQDHAERAAAQDAVHPVGARGWRVPVSVRTTLAPVALGDVLDAADQLHRPDAVQLVEDEFDSGASGGAGAPPVAVSSSSSSTLTRVRGETSARPLRTFETVENENPGLRSATWASVTRGPHSLSSSHGAEAIQPLALGNGLVARSTALLTTAGAGPTVREP